MSDIQIVCFIIIGICTVVNIWFAIDCNRHIKNAQRRLEELKRRRTDE